MTTFFFSDTPHDGIPFDVESEMEISRSQMQPRSMHCMFCDCDVWVSIRHIVPTHEVAPHRGTTVWDALWSWTLMAVQEGGDGFVVECPQCSLIHTIDHIVGEGDND